ncbi:MAG: guanylate kinase [Lachnospiraceae bacterium]|nr:guanylate kinase [Lachnospiraceae bacterium]
MGRIYYIFGKSASGKDTVYKRLLQDEESGLESIVLYTTRPIRDGEKDGVSYHFITEEQYRSLKSRDLIIEERAYDTIHGIWRYFTVNDGSFDLKSHDYVITGVLSSFISTRDYFGKGKVIPIYIEVEDGVRLERALKREMLPENRKFKEMCRRFLADDEDFSEEKLADAGIVKRFVNDDLDRCVREIRDFIITDKRT